MDQLRADIWQYLLTDNVPLLINHAQLDAKEERHLLDVKRLIALLLTVTPLTGVLLGTSLYWVKFQWWQVLRNISLLGFAVIGGLLLLVGVSGFKSSFVRFHELLFVQDTWWFMPDSVLIRAFPVGYFQQFALFFGLLVSAVFAVLHVVSRLWCRGGISSSTDTPS